MRCLIYTRVSTTTHDQTTENQVAQLKEYAHRQNWEIVEIIEEYCSGGKSAEERTGLKKVFSMARQKKFDVLLFWSLDRLSREGSRKTLEYLTRLDDCKVKWHSYTEEYISSLGIFFRCDYQSYGGIGSTGKSSFVRAGFGWTSKSSQQRTKTWSSTNC